jgi:hypothetical protein
VSWLTQRNWNFSDSEGDLPSSYRLDGLLSKGRLESRNPEQDLLGRTAGGSKEGGRHLEPTRQWEEKCKPTMPKPKDTKLLSDFSFLFSGLKNLGIARSDTEDKVMSRAGNYHLYLPIISFPRDRVVT